LPSILAFTSKFILIFTLIQISRNFTRFNFTIYYTNFTRSIILKKI